MFSDVRGLPLTTRSAGAAESYNAAVEQYLEFRPELPDTLRRALGSDSQCVMANVLFGVALRLGGNDALLPRARKHLVSAEAVAEGASARERGHVAALRCWLAGDLLGANRQYEAVLAAEPRDVLALKLLTHNCFWLGDRAKLRDAPERVLARVPANLPGYGYLLGMRAFGLEESGDYAQAEKFGRAAVELQPGDLWSQHAVAHVFEMQCRLKEGLDWLARLAPLWKGHNSFVYHLWWHRALCLFELEQWDAVLNLYDAEIRRDKTDFAPDVVNAASLLWRLELRGVRVGERWKELADIAEQRLDDMAHPFNSLHFLMALLRGGRPQSAQRALEAMRSYAQANRPVAEPGAPDWHGNTLAPVFEEVAVPVGEGLAAFLEAVHKRATERLMKSYGKFGSLGASHAQRDVLVLTFIEASREAGYLALTRDLLAARTHAKAESADAWHTYARVLEFSRDLGGAAVAQARGDAIAQRSKGVR